MKSAATAWAAAAAALALAPVAAHAQPLSVRGAPKPFFDSRTVALGSLSGGGAVPATNRTTRARGALRRALGGQLNLQIDPLTGTPRVLQRLDRALTPPARGDRAAIALAYARENAAALGLTAADFAGFRLVQRVRSPDGVLHLRWRQSYQGIPLFDNELRVNVAGDGRVVNVLGSPRHAPAVGSTTPLLSPLAAVRRVMDDVGVRRTVSVASGPSGARRVTRLSGGDQASLVLFGEAGAERLAWQLTYYATPLAHYAAVVDARTGAILYRANLTKSAGAATVWQNYPGAPDGGAAQSVSLTPYLSAGANSLTGPNAHAWSDLDDDYLVDPDNGDPLTSEEVRPVAGGNFNFSFGPFSQQDLPLTPSDPPLCPAGFRCAWDPATPTSWRANRRQNAVQAFYFVNRFHDHLRDSPIGFDAASGAFDGGDKLQLHADSGAQPGSPGTPAGDGGPDAGHLNNANMTTLPDGTPPVMNLYLFKFAAFGQPPYRDINGGDDAATVYHEYTHGLSGRLVADSEGYPALNKAQSGAMSEGWSDWFAEDYLVQQGNESDVAGQPGDIDVGRYPDYEPGATRTQPVDCPVAPSAPCPGAGTAGSGGYTYGDFAKVAGTDEVHADGEIWLETLWDLRSALIAQTGSGFDGSQAAERLITGGMRLSPPEPSFLDMRNAILAADSAAGGQYHALLWSVFRLRGMGFYAATTNADDISPVQDFSPPPAGGAQGTVSGRVVDADTGLPLGGAAVGIAGHITDPTFDDYLRATAGGDGTYRLTNVPAGTYPQLVANAPAKGWDRGVGPVTVSGGQTTTRSFSLHRDWASSAGGADIDADNDHSGNSIGCGPDAAIDQTHASGWSAWNPTSAEYPPELSGHAPTLTVQLAARVDISAFALDPGAACLGDDATAAMRDYRIDTSSDGASFHCAVATVPVSGCGAVVAPFAAASAHKLNLVAPRASAANIGWVRITLLRPLSDAAGGAGRNFIDLAELGVYGGPRNTPPSGRLVASPSHASVGSPVKFDAGSFTDPDSAIANYRWDFDGDGQTDSTTSAPQASHTFDKEGLYAARVTALDVRGGQGSATAALSVSVPRPSISVRALTRGRARITARCKLACSLTATLTIAGSTARRAGLASRSFSGKRSVKRAGRATVTLRITGAARSALRGTGVRRLKVTVRARARDAKHRTVKRSFHPKLRL